MPWRLAAVLIERAQRRGPLFDPDAVHGGEGTAHVQECGRPYLTAISTRQILATMKAIIVGGGLGGVYAAITLERAGVEAVVLERHEDLSKIQVGIGMVLWPNGTLALRAADARRGRHRPGRGDGEGRVPPRGGWRPAARVGDGRRSGAASARPPSASAAPTCTRSSTRRSPTDTLRLGQQVVGYEQDPDGVTVRTEDGESAAAIS